MGSFSVLNNIPSVNGQNQLYVNNINLARTLNRLASGKRINSGADDAAGLQIADRLRGNVMALNQAARNAADGISVLQIADGALSQVTDLLWRAVTLAEQAESEIISPQGKQALQQEYAFIQAEIDRIGRDTNFNGQTLFVANQFTSISAGQISTLGSDLQTSDARLDIFVGDLSQTQSYISVSIGTLSFAAAAGGTGLIGSASSAASLESAATSALGEINEALSKVAIMRGSIGAGMNRLQAAINVINVTSQNTLAAESGIRDANIAEEISNLTKYQILAQTGMAALAQANMNAQNVLSLLR
ncbi:MAG: flagellin [Acidobacteria bacterium]|nr:flagellin [Acidobacteriota bacterium]